MLFERILSRYRQILFWLLLLLLFGAHAALDPAANLRQQMSARFGAARLPVLDEWQAMLNASTTLNDAAKLKLTNDFFNKNIVFDSDINIWQKSDYWATPLETMGRGQGDCEDYAIAKYYSLLILGVPVKQMRLVYVKAQFETVAGPVQQAHMVLAYYDKPSADPQILDNLIPTIRKASQRPDLSPVFSFNSEGIFAGVSSQENGSIGRTDRLSRWEELMRRARAEGFDALVQKSLSQQRSTRTSAATGSN
ncbi:MAG: transglutaminase-like cysteine peptidase [Pseudomonadota bacterium]